MSNFSLSINNFLYLAKWNKLFAFGTKAITSMLLFVTLLFSQTASAQIDLTSCYGSCTSNDFTITKAFLTDINGIAIDPNACATGTGTVTAYLSFIFTNNTNSDRNGIFISGTINGTYIYQCFDGILPKKSAKLKTATLYPVTWTCGTDLTLRNTFVSWGSGSDNVCSQTCAQATPSKCRTVGDLVIQTPLSANFTTLNSCTGTNNYQTVAFSATASGGNHSYTYSWNFGDGSAAGSGASVSHTYSTANNYSVILTVTDGAGTSTTATHSVTVIACCTPPTITTQPSAVSQCAGTSASFTVVYSGGSPTPSVQWQVMTNGGSTWTNLTSVSPYSGVTTATLSISSISGLNGNQYRAVLTSGVCTSVNSNAALLTVNALPSNPVASVTTSPTCSTASGIVTVSSPLGSQYEYSNNGGTSYQPGTTFTVAAGASYSISVRNTTTLCTSVTPATGSMGAQPSAPDAPEVTITTSPDCSSATGTLAVRNSVTHQAYGTGYEFSNDGGTTWVTTTSFSFTAGAGYNITVRRTSDHTCTANTTCTGGAAVVAATRQQLSTAIQPIELNPQPTVKAAPNPFNDKVRFSVKSAISGQGTLDLYNMLGQKVKTVFQGHVEAGQVQNFEYNVPNAQRSNLIYMFRVGDQRVSGKLVGLNR